MAHAVAVGAQAREIVELGLPGSGDVERSDVVHFDVTVTEAAVDKAEVEVADLTPERPLATANLLDLQLAELGVPFAGEGSPDEKPSLDCGGSAVVDLVGLPRKKLQFARPDAVLDRLSGLKHFCFPFGKGLDHQARGLPAAGALAQVGAVVRREVRGLTAHAVRRPEAGQRVCLRAVERQRTEQFRQLLYLSIIGPQFAPAVLNDERSGQYQFILSPRRAPHEQYRMSVRRYRGCVQRTAGRVAHYVWSRCQWGLSPSVMVDCKMCLPLHDCKEGHDPHERT